MISTITLPKITDKRGTLSFLESQHHLPFKIKNTTLLYRINCSDKYIFENNNETYFAVFALSGSFVLTDQVGNSTLDQPHVGICITETSFDMSNFSSGSVVLVLSSKENINFKMETY